MAPPLPVTVGQSSANNVTSSAAQLPNTAEWAVSSSPATRSLLAPLLPPEKRNSYHLRRLGYRLDEHVQPSSHLSVAAVDKTERASNDGNVWDAAVSKAVINQDNIRNALTVVDGPAVAVLGQQLSKKTHKQKVSNDDGDQQASTSSTAKGKESTGKVDSTVEAELDRPGVVAGAFVVSDDEIEENDMLDRESSRHASPTQSESDTGVDDSGGTSGACVERLTDQNGRPTSTATSSHTALDILSPRLSSDRADQRIQFDYEPKSGYHYVDSIGLERPSSFPIRPPLPPSGSAVVSLQLKRILGLDLQQQGATAQEAGRDAYQWLESMVELAWSFVNSSEAIDPNRDSVKDPKLFKQFFAQLRLILSSRPLVWYALYSGNANSAAPPTFHTTCDEEGDIRTPWWSNFKKDWPIRYLLENYLHRLAQHVGIPLLALAPIIC